MNGEFRLVLLLLASAAGYPALARNWFDLLRTTNSGILVISDEPIGPDAEAWIQFKKLYDSTLGCTTTNVTNEMLCKWLDVVERFTF
jgi:hypothetical protein